MVDLSSKTKVIPEEFRRFRWVRAAVLCVLVSTLLLTPRPLRGQLSTEDHVAGPGFWPTKEQPSQSAFAPDGSCERCHAGIARSAKASSMGRGAMHPDVADTFKRQPHLSFLYAPDLYRIDTVQDGKGTKSIYSVTDGKDKVAWDLLWVFGTDRVGQSYLFKKEDGNYYEARVTHYRSLDNIAFTPARELTQPTDLMTAVGRQVGTAELIRCFNCHATAVEIGGHFNEAGLRPGVTCEACHGPGAAHVAAMNGNPGAAQDLAIFNPSTLTPTDSVEFCGACHGSWWDVKLAHVTGPSTVRSAPYRLVTSKCWGKSGDARLVCTACHDPHAELVTDTASYDGACLQCHGNAPAPGSPAAVAHSETKPPTCPVGKSKCAGCHMPKVYVPEMKNMFTDHRIRIVRANEPFQD